MKKKDKGFSLAFRWFSARMFERAGYVWEVRRSGDLKLGIWRKRLGRSEAKRKTSYKRFVLIPGFGDSPNTWLLVLSLISPVLKRQGYEEFVVLDFPGFNGRLADDRCFHSLDLLFDAVGDLLDWLEPHTIFAHSLGGWLAGRYAVDCGSEARPKNRKRHGYAGPELLLLAAPAGVYENEQARQDVQQIFQDLTSNKGFPALRPHLFAKEPIWFPWVWEGFARFATDAGIRSFTESVREDHLLEDRLSQIRARTWLIWGDQDTLVPTAGKDRWLEGLQDRCEPRVVLLKGVGHSPHIEKPAVTAAVMAQILLGRVPHGKGSRWWEVTQSESVSEF